MMPKYFAECFVNHLLRQLGALGGELPALLDCFKQSVCALLISKRSCQLIGCGDGVLYGKVDADAKDRRHGVRRVANT